MDPVSTPEEKTDPTVTAQAADSTEAATTARCRSCSTPLADGQEWCLECGAARTPNRWRSGRRSLALTAGLTISLLGVAVAASYAAIVDSPPVTATATVPGAATQVAQAPPVTTTPTDEIPPADTSTDESLAQIDSGASAGDTALDDTTASTDVITPDTSSDSTYTPPDTSSDEPTQAEIDAQKKAEKKAKAKAKAEAKRKAIAELKASRLNLSAGSGSLYDPEGHQLAADGGDPGGAFGDSTASAWLAQTDPQLASMDIGLLVDLGKSTGVSRVSFKTTTPGFTVEIYGSDGDAPPEITSARWAHLRTRRDVDGKSTADGNKAGDEHEIITFEDDVTKYRHLVLWLTKAPSDGPPARISVLRVHK